MDTAGNVYVADTGNNMVKKVAPNGKITQIGSGFSTPMGVAVHNGAVYVADTGHNAVKKVAPVGPITKVGSGFKTPVGVAVGKYGYVYVNDLGNHAVKKVAPDGEITEIVWRGLCFGATYVSGVAVDAIANVYVSVNCTHFYGGLHSATVFKIRPNGQTTTLFSQGDWINGVAVVKPGGLYYSQGSNGSRFVPSAVYYKTLGKRTKVGSGFSAPMGLALHNGAVYVADTGNNAVEKVTP